jgi:hypothetical protein
MRFVDLPTLLTSVPDHASLPDITCRRLWDANWPPMDGVGHVGLSYIDQLDARSQLRNLRNHVSGLLMRRTRAALHYEEARRP